MGSHGHSTKSEDRLANSRLWWEDCLVMQTWLGGKRPRIQQPGHFVVYLGKMESTSDGHRRNNVLVWRRKENMVRSQSDRRALELNSWILVRSKAGQVLQEVESAH